jgi:predicted O-methyltransferase YrrM
MQYNSEISPLSNYIYSLTFQGSVVIADNILRPGVPKYKEYMEKETGLYTSSLQQIGHDAIYISFVN